MTDIEFISTDQHGLDSIGFLWEKLREHHRVRSPHHAGRMARMTFEWRKQGILKKIGNGHLYVNIAKDTRTGKFVGYCISSVTEKNVGEIESIYIESAYRRHGIGDVFMKKALKWMDSLDVKIRAIGVAAGNEEVFPFYARYGFFPGDIILRPPDYE